MDGTSRIIANTAPAVSGKDMMMPYSSLGMLNSELAARVYTAPSLVL